MFKSILVFRVKPGKELLGELGRYCKEHGIRSAIVLGLIGSVQHARLNYLKELPGKYEGVDYAGPLEIACGQGSVAVKGSEVIAHVHLELASQQACHGGHLVEAVVFSTAEVVLGELVYQLRRDLDVDTGLNELVDPE